VDIQLYADTAPVAVNSFVFLARRGWFDGNEIFHVVPGLMVEAGDPTGTGFGTPGYHFDLEESSRSFDGPGVVGVSSTGPGTNGSQFFVTLAPLPSLDGSRTIMGQVVAGLDHLQALAAREPLSDLLLPAAGVILSVTIEER
jgi:cyclophilin family peptidyl-prolyl cis-trans isomerase